MLGWSYIDWVSQWPRGVPPASRGDQAGPCCLQDLVYLLALQHAAELEAHLGEPELAAMYRRFADALSARLRERFLVPDGGVLADDPAHEHRSQHAQIYGILAGVLGREEGSRALDAALADPAFVVGSYYFRFYLFEALRRLGRGGEIVGHLAGWQEMLDLGARTVWENLEPTRSDAHAWSSHPMFHLPCSVLGIRPAAPGFAEVVIAPDLGPLGRASARVAHPAGLVEVELHREGDRLRGAVTLPPGVVGRLLLPGRDERFVAGRQEV